MCYVLMEVFQKLGCPSVCFGEGHLYVVKVAYGSQDNQMHRAEFSNQAFKFFATYGAIQGVVLSNVFRLTMCFGELRSPSTMG